MPKPDQKALLTFIIFVTLFFTSFQEVHAFSLSNLFSPLKDPKCGDVVDIGKDSYAPGSNADAHGDPLNETDPNNPTQPPVRKGTIFLDVDLTTGTDLKTPTGDLDVEHLLGKCRDGFVVEEKTTCEEIQLNCLQAPKLEDNANMGVAVRSLSPDELAPDRIQEVCDLYRDAYTKKTQAVLQAQYQLTGADEGCAIPPKTNVAMPSWGPMLSMNKVWQTFRSPDFVKTLEDVNVKYSDYLKEATNGYIRADSSISDESAGTVAGLTTSVKPKGEVLADTNTCSVGGGSGMRRIDTAMCYLSSAASILSRIVLGPVLGTDKEEYPLNFQLGDPALSGDKPGPLFTTQESQGGAPTEDIYPYVYYNYNVAPLTAGPDEVERDLYTEPRFSPGEGEDPRFAVGDVQSDNGLLYFAQGHKTAEMINNCRSTKSPDEEPEDRCGEDQFDEFGVSPSTPATAGPKDGGPPGPDVLSPVNDPSTYNPATFNKPDCKTCNIKPDGEYKQVKPGSPLIALIDEAAQAFDVPGNVLLGLLIHEGWHPSGPHLFNFTDQQIRDAITNGDPYCVRNEWCAAGPFQFTTNPSMFKGTLNEVANNTCKNHPYYPNIPDVWSSYTGAPGTEKRAKFNQIIGASADYQPHPCKLRDAAFAGANFLKTKTSYLNASITETTTCSQWDATAMKDAWRGYQGSCANNYCTGSAELLAKVCVP